MASEQEQQRPGARKAPLGQCCPCANPGNPVFSCMLDPKAEEAQLLLYRTTSGDYGCLAPQPQTAPCRFCPRENAFTTRLLACGRKPSSGINTGVDRGRVIDHADLVNTL